MAGAKRGYVPTCRRILPKQNQPHLLHLKYGQKLTTADVMEYGWNHEQEILRQYSEFRNRSTDKPLKKGGNTELFTRDILGLDKAI